MPEIGYNMLKGVLRSQGINVPIVRIQQCIREVDSINISLRWAVKSNLLEWKYINNTVSLINKFCLIGGELYTEA